MYASCGWFFDDIAGLEAALVLRLGGARRRPSGEAGRRSAAGGRCWRSSLAGGEQQKEAGHGSRHVPAGGSGSIDHGARRGGRWRVGMACGPRGKPAVTSSGLAVDIHGLVIPRRRAGAWTSRDRSGARDRRTDRASTLDDGGSWAGAAAGPQEVRDLVDGVRSELGELGRESRHRLLPILMPRLLDSSPSSLAGRAGAWRWCKDVVGLEEAPEDPVARQGCPVAAAVAGGGWRGTMSSPRGGGPDRAFVEAAGSALASGSPERNWFEENRRAHRVPCGGAPVAGLAHRSGSAADPAPGPPPGLRHRLGGLTDDILPSRGPTTVSDFCDRFCALCATVSFASSWQREGSATPLVHAGCDLNVLFLSEPDRIVPWCSLLHPPAFDVLPPAI